LDVTHDIGSRRSAYAEGAVSLLPSKPLTGFIDPLGRASLEELKGFCQRQGRWQNEEGVYLLADALTNDHGFEALIVGDSGHVGPELRLDVIGDRLFSALCAEDNVDWVVGV
jgi:hypothetical protein